MDLLLTLLFPQKIRSGTPLERKCLGFKFLGITIIGWIALILLPVQVVSAFPPNTTRIFRQIQRSLIVLDAFLYLAIFRTGLSGRKAQTARAINLFYFLHLADRQPQLRNSTPGSKPYL
jgi:hypothetical protein